MLYQIRMDQPAYDKLGRYHLVNTHMRNFFVRGCVPYLGSLAAHFQAYRPDSLFLFFTKNGIS